ncbi:MAG: hypothetical protein ACJ75S_00465 [Solirubrobacterales bacterium]
MPLGLRPWDPGYEATTEAVSMIRQAHTYLAGAVSGTALIGAAVVTFVMLVSLQALKDWPLAGIGGGGDSAAVSTGQPASGTGNAASGAGAAAARAAGNGANRADRRPGGVDALRGQLGGNAAGGTSPAPSGGEAPSGGAGSTPSSTSGGGSGGSGSGGGSTGSGSGQSTSGAVTGAANETVSGVDQATGGALGSTGVTKVTEETVNGVAGPESRAGKTVDEVVKTVGGLPDGGK